MELDVRLRISVKLVGLINASTEVDLYLPHLKKSIVISVPNSISKKDTLRLKGMGNISPDGEKGNLYLEFDNIDNSNVYSKAGTCSNCGHELAHGAEYCFKCGSKVGESNKSNNQRQQRWAGEIIECPRCGEVLKSFEINCPSCGHEFRNVKASTVVKEFASKLEAIEARREYEKPRGLFSSQEALQRISKTDEQKISLIKNFAIPNSKEDMLEFMILATSNMNMNTYDSTNTTISKGEKELNAAWYSKVQQVYEKAKRSYSTDNVFIEIKNLYDKCNEEIKKAKRKGPLKWILMFGLIALVYAILIPIIVITNSKQEKQEIERLDNIVVEVQTALENEEYKHALRIADSIDYQRRDVEMERKWDIQRQYWVEKVLEEAAEKGIQLVYTPSEDIDNANDNDEEVTTHEGFIDGLEEGMQPGLEEMEKSIDEFNRIIDEATTNEK